MKKNLILMFAFLMVFALSFQAASAQITITIPKIPKIKKPKIEQPPPETPTTDNNQTVPDRTPESKTTSQASDDEPMDARLSLFLDELAKAQKEVDEYNPNDDLYLVGANATDWLWRAVSAKERNEWTEKWKTLMTPATRKKFDTALDTLAASAAKKLPSYKSSLKDYTVRNPAEEKLMKGVLTNIADYKIHSIGLKQSNWLIDKNDYGLPTARYKHGVIYLRNTKSDHPYCYATYVNIKQDYAGGGTYGASYARFIQDEMVGCPATAK